MIERIFIALGDLVTVLLPSCMILGVVTVLYLVCVAAYSLFTVAAREEQMMDEWDIDATNPKFQPEQNND
jgi:hypothetical protein